MLGYIVTCGFLFELFYSHPPDKRHTDRLEVDCIVEAVRPIEEADGRQQIKVNCTTGLSNARLTDSVLNHKVRWAIYQEDCI